MAHPLHFVWITIFCGCAFDSFVLNKKLQNLCLLSQEINQFCATKKDVTLHMLYVVNSFVVLSSSFTITLFLAPKQMEMIPAPDQFLISPITGEKIPADKIQEHMRIGKFFAFS